MIEDELSNIAAALEKIYEALANGRPAVTVTSSTSDAEPEKSPAPRALSYEEDIRQPFLAFASSKGNAEAVKFLNRFEVKSARDLKVEQYPEFVRALGEARGAEALA